MIVSIQPEEVVRLLRFLTTGLEEYQKANGGDLTILQLVSIGVMYEMALNNLPDQNDIPKIRTAVETLRQQMKEHGMWVGPIQKGGCGRPN